jgi:DnaJ-class molecular chaperone
MGTPPPQRQGDDLPPEELFAQFGDLFADLFAGSNKPGGWPGGDVLERLPLSLEESVRGCTRDVSVPTWLPCRVCAGSGVTGTRPCVSCEGRRGQSARKTVRVTVPPGIEAGQKLRLAGQGNPRSDGAPGHLYLRIEIAPHASLSREGLDVIARVRIDPALAQTGGTLCVPWVDGDAEVAIPAGTAHRDRIVRRGWGAVPMGQPWTPPPATDAPYRSPEAPTRGDLVVIALLEESLDDALERELAAVPAQTSAARHPLPVRHAPLVEPPPVEVRAAAAIVALLVLLVGAALLATR